VKRLEVIRLRRDGRLVEILVHVPGVESVERAVLCNPEAEEWLGLARASDETEIAFIDRVRALAVSHGGYIAWNGLPEPPEWMQ
jgi:hypothetical protein